MTIRYFVYDVFTDTPFGGNQLGVIPDATALAEDSLLAIAREFNYSETVFLYPPDDPANTARVRIFTPGGEVPFAGHPTIGTAVALAEAGMGPEMVLELGVGALAARAENGRASFETRVPVEILARPERTLVARALGLPEHALLSQPVMATLGLPFTFTELASREDLAACTPDLAAMREGRDAYPAAMDFAQFVFVADGSTVHARMFAPLDGIPEDPATGSASATLGALAVLRDGAARFTVRQGEDMGRLSLIEVDARPGAVTVSGQAVRTMQGELLL